MSTRHCYRQCSPSPTPTPHRRWLGLWTACCVLLYRLSIFIGQQWSAGRTRKPARKIKSQAEVCKSFHKLGNAGIMLVLFFLEINTLNIVLVILSNYGLAVAHKILNLKLWRGDKGSELKDNLVICEQTKWGGQKKIERNWTESVNYYQCSNVCESDPRIFEIWRRRGLHIVQGARRLPPRCNLSRFHEISKLAWPDAIQPSCNP